MDGQTNFLLNWTYCYQEKSMDELRQSLPLSMELEDTRVKAREELKVRDEEIAQLKELLNKAIKERDEVQEMCEKLFLEKLLLQQKLEQKCHQSTQNSGISSIDDDPRRVIEINNGFSYSDCEESIVSPPHLIPPPPPAAAAEVESAFPLAPNRPLPEKGKLLQAVIKSGPLLQTLLLAGPLPHWRHPPPPLDSCQIPPPPVAIPLPPLLNLSSHSIRQDSFDSNDIKNSGLMINRNKGLSEGTDCSIELKYPRFVLQ